MNNEYAATVGFFDGVHSGHQYLIRQLREEARKRNLKSMIITFGTHPRKVLHESYQPRLLTSPQEKLELLNASGVDMVTVLDFTPEMAHLTAGEFINAVLAEQLKVKFLLVGHDHKFGRNREEGFTQYVQHGLNSGVEVLQANRFSTSDQQHISSSVIRRLLEEGEITKVNNLLGYPYTLTGFVVNGYQVGRKIGFPTANLNVIPEEKIIPATGVYAVSVEWQHQQFSGMMNIGFRPTLENSHQLSLEVHIINFREDIYHQQLKINFLRKIRDEQKFDSMDALILQLEQDKAFVLNNLQ